MKVNKIERKRPKGLIITIVALVALALAALGVTLAYEKLQALWREPCVVTDAAALVTCTDGTMVRSGTLLEMFGIRNGVNLAEIDFDAKRLEILKSFPEIRALTVTRLLPNRLDIRAEERQPVVRLGVHGVRGTTGCVADAEGVVFKCRRGTSMLPTLRERADATTPVGQRLAGRSRAALELVTTASDAHFAALGILDADTSKPDYILATLSNYNQAKIAWDGMDEPTPASHALLARHLDNLLKAITSDIAYGVKVWNATQKDRIFADTRENIL